MTTLTTLLRPRSLPARLSLRPPRCAAPSRQAPCPARRAFTTTTRANARRPQAPSKGPSSRLALSLAAGGLLAVVHHQRPMRLDAWSLSSSPAARQTQPYATGRNQRERGGDAFGDAVRELSMGSVSGFVAGLLVSVFSKTLVLLAGIGIVVVQVAAKSGIDLVAYLKLKERANLSRILATLNRHAAFKLSFGLAFAMSAFMSL
ncbi:hypothetical protein VTJ83DRAFT_2640 [Remersonia thermophila]|uniref:Uncharacterized protein n=1 Tax=Remersonia thermophila TaxID=72144 RepID=A0ABR4DKT5_9PEZI